MATPTTPTPRAPRGAGPYVVLALALAALGTLAYLGFTFVTTESEQGASPNTTSPPATTAAPAPPSTSESDAGEAAPTTLAAPLEIPEMIGVCFDGEWTPQEGIRIVDLTQVPCEQPHVYEVFDLVTHSADSSVKYPGEVPLANLAAPTCVGTFEEFVGTPWMESGFVIFVDSPGEQAWQSGARDMYCALVRGDREPNQRSARNQLFIKPNDHVATTLLNEGDCLNVTGWGPYVQLVPCVDAHDAEVIAVHTLTDPWNEPYDPDSVPNPYTVCGREYDHRVDPAYPIELIGGPLVSPTSTTWAAGHRSTVCIAQAAQGQSLYHSVQLGNTRYAALLRDYFGEGVAGPFSGLASPGALDDHLRLVRSAHRENERLVLTTFAESADRGVSFEREAAQKGAVWTVEEVAIDQGFATAFVFQLERYQWVAGGDGFAFVVQDKGVDAIGGRLGYHNMQSSLAVEFDTVVDRDEGDPTALAYEIPRAVANHISVHTRGTQRNTVHEDASIAFVDPEPIRLADRNLHVVLIAYEPGLLTVYIDEFETPALSVDVDLEDLLGIDDGSAWLGFTASSGPAVTGHKIVSWHLESGTQG